MKRILYTKNQTSLENLTKRLLGPTYLKKYYKSLHEGIYADDNEVNMTEATDCIPAT